MNKAEEEYLLYRIYDRIDQHFRAMGHKEMPETDIVKLRAKFCDTLPKSTLLTEDVLNKADALRKHLGQKGKDAKLYAVLPSFWVDETEMLWFARTYNLEVDDVYSNIKSSLNDLYKSGLLLPFVVYGYSEAEIRELREQGVPVVEVANFKASSGRSWATVSYDHYFNDIFAGYIGLVPSRVYTSDITKPAYERGDAIKVRTKFYEFCVVGATVNDNGDLNLDGQVKSATIESKTIKSRINQGFNVPLLKFDIINQIEYI